jgi:hypothetical protein
MSFKKLKLNEYLRIELIKMMLIKKKKEVIANCEEKEMSLRK